MAFCRQVDDTVDMLILHELVERVKVANVHLHELVVRLVLDILEVRKVARVGKLIEVDNLVFRILIDKESNDMASDKARAAGNDNGSFHNFPLVFNLAFCNFAQMLTIGGFAVLGCGFKELFLANPTIDIGNFLDCANLDSLAVFDHLHEFACFDEAVHGAGIKPGETTAEQFYVEFPLFQVNTVEVRNFKLAASRRFNLFSHFNDAAIIEIKTRYTIV